MTVWVAPRGLRASVTLAFALGALALSASLSLGTYFAARHLLVEQRERTALRQAYTDAALVRDSLLTSGSEVSEVLGSIAPPTGAVMYLHRNDTWYSSSLDPPGQGVTDAVARTVDAGSVGLAWTDLTDPHAVVVGVPLPAVDAAYYEVSVAEELAATLRTLALALAVCAALTTVGGALLGRAASSRVLQPLGEVAGAAVQVSAGDLETHLRDTSDPDLAVLVGAFNHMVDALHERIERDARFAADVSHELRTPLTTLTTSLGVLQDVPGLSPGASSAVQLMATELTRFRRALEDLLALGRLDAGAGEGDIVSVGAHELSVRRCRRAVGRRTSCRPGDGDDPLVDVDRRQVLRALVNLFQNADLHGDGLTEVRGGHVDGHVEFRVRDRGAGVPTQDRERIFERFARAGGARAGTGSGLGLSIVARTATNHGGSVWCSSAHDRGAESCCACREVAQGRWRDQRTASAAAVGLLLLVAGCGLPGDTEVGPSTATRCRTTCWILSRGRVRGRPGPCRKEPRSCSGWSMTTGWLRQQWRPRASTRRRMSSTEQLALLAAAPDDAARRVAGRRPFSSFSELELVDVFDDVAHVEFDPATSLTADRLPLAMGQLVLTVTSAPGIEAVQVRAVGDTIEVPLPGGALTDRPVTADDYAIFLPERFPGTGRQGLSTDIGCPTPDGGSS